MADDPIDLDLDRVWDALSNPSRSTEVPADPETAVVRRLHALSITPLPNGMRDRVWRGVVLPSAERPSVQSSPAGPPVSVNGHGREVPLSVHPRRQTVGMRLASILAAVLLVAIVGGITGAVLTNRWRSAEAPRPPSILAPGSPDGLTETLVELTLPAELRPSSDQFLAVFRSVTAAANSRATWVANPCCPGPRVLYVLAGSYTAQAMNGPLTVHRAGVSVPESIERGTDVTLEPGDLAFVGQGTKLLLANQTSTPVRLLTWQLTTDSTLSGPSPQTDIPVGWTMEANVYQFDVVLPSGGLSLRLQRVILDPADIVKMPPRSFSQALKSGGAGAFIRRDDNAITNPGTESVDLYLLSLVPVEGDGTPSSVDTAGP